MKLTKSKLKQLIKETLTEGEWEVREHTEFSRIISEIKSKLRRAQELLARGHVRTESLSDTVLEDIEAILEHEATHSLQEVLREAGYESTTGWHLDDADYEAGEESEDQ